MSDDRFPKPPASDAPISLTASDDECDEMTTTHSHADRVLNATIGESPRNQTRQQLQSQLSALEAVIDAYSNDDIDTACNALNTVLVGGHDLDMASTLIDAISSLAYSKDQYPPSLTAMLCLAVDVGLLKHAYNAANRVMDTAQSPSDYKVAERYFKMAMSDNTYPKLQAAAHVNYCPIVRDGLITGKPDWPAAVEIYEAAARMGLLKAMFNAGNVSTWLVQQDKSYGERANYWFEYAIGYYEQGQPLLDMESADELVEVVIQCKIAAAGLHIDAQFDGADLEKGIALAKSVAVLGNERALHNLGIGYTRRMARLTAAPGKTPGANWRAVLSAMDWVFVGDIETINLVEEGEPVLVDRMTIRIKGDKTANLFVTHDPGLPCHEGLTFLKDIAAHLALENHDPFLLLPRKATFVEHNKLVYFPILVINSSTISHQALWASATPDLILQNGAVGAKFLDKRFGDTNCMIPIAVNALDEGLMMTEIDAARIPWIDVGEPWRMPFIKQDKLAEVGLAADEVPL